MHLVFITHSWVTLYHHCKNGDVKVRELGKGKIIIMLQIEIVETDLKQ